MSLEKFKRAMNKGVLVTKFRLRKRLLLPGRKRKHTLSGGPFDRVSVMLHSAGTLPIRIGALVGRYDEKGNWIDLYE